MQLPPFLLDQWLDEHLSGQRPVEFDLASSTGPSWTLEQLLDLASPLERRRFLDSPLVYARGTGGDEVREAIAAMSGVAMEDVQVFTGASEALLILFFLASEPGANVVLPHPVFAPIEHIPRSFGLEVRQYELRPDRGFRLDPEKVMALTDAGTRLMLVNTPHNPTGAVTPLEHLRALDEFCARRGIQFVCDEVYHPIYFGWENPSAATLPHVTVLGDMSKALCLSGLRVGWMIERNGRRRREAHNARCYFSISNAPIAEVLAVIALREHDRVLTRVRVVASESLRLLDQFMERHRALFRWTRPEGGLTAFPALVGAVDARAFCERAAAQGVLLAPGDCFGMADRFRVGLGASGERFRAGLERLEVIVAAEPARA